MMKKIIILSLSLVFSINAIYGSRKPKNLLKNELDSVSYSIGVVIGISIKSVGMKEINEEVFSKVLKSIISGDTSILLNNDQANAYITKYMQKQANLKTEGNKKAGIDFLEENKKKPDVITLPSGLQYQIITTGTGERPTISDKVTVHYHGTLIDGKVFDSSVERGEPIQLSVNGVIKGWTEALQMMPTGSKWKLFIPSELAYGSQAMQSIAPNSVLIFDVELISIDK
jgi:FKBP-type peptidyl-prolyl cis-trans isomerase FklB